MALRNYKHGLPLHGELNSEDASSPLEIPLYEPENRNQVILTLADFLDVTQMSIVTSVGGDCYFFFDVGGVALPILSAETTGDTLQVTGDCTRNFLDSQAFVVYGSTGNDGVYNALNWSYNPVTNRTTITVAALADGTDDGFLAFNFHPIVAASTGSNTLTVAGDQRELFRVDREFRVADSTGNDNGGSNYTVTGASYSATTDRTTIIVASVASAVADGFIVPQVTEFDGQRMYRGGYSDAGGAGRAGMLWRGTALGPVGHVLYGVAPAGTVDFEVQAHRRIHIPRTANAGGPRN